MKAVRRVCLAATVTLFLSSSTWSQATAPGGGATAVPTIPTAAYNVQTDAEIQPYKPAIVGFVNAQVGLLTGTDPKARADARDAIIQKVPTNNAALPIYMKTYGEALNAAVLPVLSKAEPFQKLIVAITVAKVAERTGNASLAGATRQLLKDTSEAIVLWGVKAAQPIIPVLAANSLDPNVALIGELTATAIARSNSPWIIDEAYVALTLGKLPKDLLTAQQMPAVNKVLFPEVQKLFAHRLSLYANGVPAMPSAETRATAYFVSSEVWKRMPLTPQQQVTVVQNLTDLLNAAVNQFAAKAEARNDLVPLIKLTASAFWVVGDYAGAGEIKQAVPPLQQVNQGAAPATLRQNADNLLTAVAAEPAYKSLKGLPAAPAAASAR